MASLDLKDAYLHVPIAQSSQKFLRLAVNLGKSVWHLQFRALPFKAVIFPQGIHQSNGRSTGTIEAEGHLYYAPLG